MGRQLDEEAEARRERDRRPSSSGLRRGRLWGRTDPNIDMVRYAEAWARQIENNMPVETVREIKQRPHVDPLVTVALRADGSVESVVIVVTSGVPEIDEAIRRAIDSQRNWQPFPPSLAREFDVIEIRRTWFFDVTVRLY